MNDNALKGRFPAQTFVNSAAAERLDLQSGVSQATDNVRVNKPSKNIAMSGDKSGHISYGHNDSGGCSKILHKCDFDKEDHDLYFYCSKVSGKERNEGLQGRMDKKEGRETRGDFAGDNTTPINENNHPTLKPISLLVQILRLFKTPNPQVLLDPFAGSGTMAIAANKVGGFDYVGIELNPDYFAIAKERIAHAEHDLINLFG